MRIAAHAFAVALGLSIGLAGCSHATSAPSAEDVIASGWDAHEQVLAAGEHAASCSDMGPAMQRAVAAHRQQLTAAFALERDTDQLARIVTFLEAHQDRLDDLARRGDALRARCPDDAAVVAAFRDLQPP